MDMDFNTKVQFTRTRNVKMPNRANKHDAGTDFFVPYYNQEFLVDLIKKNTGNKIFYKIENDDLFITIPAGEHRLTRS